MPLLTIFSRIRASFSLGAANPANYFGSTYRGTYEVAGNRISGFVTDCGQDKRFPPASILVMRDGTPAGSTSELKRIGDGWRFDLDCAEPFTPTEVVRDKIKVFAVDHRDGRSELLVEGAVQLSYVREALAPPSETELVIDFARGGNSKEHIGGGWSSPEPRHTWTDGRQATIALVFQHPGSRYRLEMLARPYVVASVLPQQTMQVSIDGNLVHIFVVNFGLKLLECDITEEITNTAGAMLRLDFPEAVRPCDVTGENEGRMIAFGFRRLTLKRYLEASSPA